jgi:hypothetical protein
MLYPYIATWFARHPQLDEMRKGDFLKQLMIGGWVLDPTTSTLLSKNLPKTHIQQVNWKYYFHWPYSYLYF